MVLAKIYRIINLTFFFSIFVFAISCENIYSPEDADCANCLSFEPQEADLYISVTLDSKYREIPIVVLKGKFGSGDTVAVDTIRNDMGYIPVPINEFYTVIAEYNSETRTVRSVDGDEITKYDISNKCGEICWIIRGGLINVTLKYD